MEQDESTNKSKALSNSEPTPKLTWRKLHKQGINTSDVNILAPMFRNRLRTWRTGSPRAN